MSALSSRLPLESNMLPVSYNTLFRAAANGGSPRQSIPHNDKATACRKTPPRLRENGTVVVRDEGESLSRRLIHVGSQY